MMSSLVFSACCISQGVSLVQSRAVPMTAADNAPVSRTRACIAVQVALDLEKKYILDWIAWHKLLGIDCFLFTMDPDRQNMTDGLVSSVQQALLSSPMVKMVTVPYGRHAPKHLLDIAPADAKYVFFFDIDEYLVPNRTALQPCNSTVNGITKITELLSDHVKGSLGLYLNRYNYGPSGWEHPPPYREHPEIAFYNQRSKNKHDRGKYVVDLEEVNSAGPESFHWRSHVLDDENATVPMKMPDDQILSLNHYVSRSVEECEFRLNYALNFRSRAKDCQAGKYTVVDDVLAGWSDCVRNERATLFGDAALS
eukprot:TRINITY_DN1756_c0_g1_i2.p1 TRINITY_DN1756_c0_g1~~TRINITY_DN1756_c0_g1_i2.p1  ORF type:complete len:353 (+),score=21.95 TRINITY_DN1756_c0_g1_i2:131-1060(+)